MGSKNHLVVPTPLITQIAKLRSGNISRAIAELAKAKLIAKLQNAKCTFDMDQY
jgi:RIO kinase 2